MKVANHLTKILEEKTLISVLSGILRNLSIDEIKHNLMKVGFEVILAARMHKKIEGTRIERA